jgi:hypothetical protein
LTESRYEPAQPWFTNAFQEEINQLAVKELLSASDLDVRCEKKRCLPWCRAHKPWGIDVIDVRITGLTMWKLLRSV